MQHTGQPLISSLLNRVKELSCLTRMYQTHSRCCLRHPGSCPRHLECCLRHLGSCPRHLGRCLRNLGSCPRHLEVVFDTWEVVLDTWDVVFDTWEVILDTWGIHLRTHCQVICLLYTSPSPRDGLLSRMPSSA